MNAMKTVKMTNTAEDDDKRHDASENVPSLYDGYKDGDEVDDDNEIISSYWREKRH